MDLSIVVLALPFLVVLASAMYIWIQMVSPGTVLFRQTRIGRGGNPFTIYKFRSMTHQAATHVHEAHVEHLIRSNEPMIKLDIGDSRLIKGGCLIRHAGLDELPQLINVLRGEMSLTGPRPCLPSEAKLYEGHQMRRFEVLPGLTGNWQVKRNESTTFSEMVAMDDEYVERLSPLNDLMIVLKTPFALAGQMRHCAKVRSQGAGKQLQAIRSASVAKRPAYRMAMSRTQKVSD